MVGSTIPFAHPVYMVRYRGRFPDKRAPLKDIYGEKEVENCMNKIREGLTKPEPTEQEWKELIEAMEDICDHWPKRLRNSR